MPIRKFKESKSLHFSTEILTIQPQTMYLQPNMIYKKIKVLTEEEEDVYVELKLKKKLRGRLQLIKGLKVSSVVLHVYFFEVRKCFIA